MNPIWILIHDSPEMKEKLQRKQESHMFAVIIYNESSVMAELGRGLLSSTRAGFQFYSIGSLCSERGEQTPTNCLLASTLTV